MKGYLHFDDFGNLYLLPEDLVRPFLHSRMWGSLDPVGFTTLWSNYAFDDDLEGAYVHIEKVEVGE